MLMENIEFQIYDWLEDTYIDLCDSDSENNNIGKYIIHLFGRCENGKSIYAKVINYTPFFYILLPDNVQNFPRENIEIIKKKLERWLKENKKIFYKYKSSL